MNTTNPNIHNRGVTLASVEYRHGEWTTRVALPSLSPVSAGAWNAFDGSHGLLVHTPDSETLRAIANAFLAAAERIEAS